MLEVDKQSVEDRTNPFRLARILYSTIASGNPQHKMPLMEDQLVLENGQVINDYKTEEVE
ncbi:hypothetical protein QQ045_019374 [Rhodiola kirilowii]